MQSPREVDPRLPVVVGLARTPIGSLGGALSKTPATKLGSIAIASALARARLPAAKVQEVFLGNVLSAGLGQAPARQAALGAGIPPSCPCTTVNKVCSSGLKAVALAAAQIKLGHVDCAVAGGMESMSLAPFYVDGLRFGRKLGHGALVDGMQRDGLEDAYSREAMGNCGERCAVEESISRAAQDTYAKQSYERAKAATARQKFASEVVPVELPPRRGSGGAPVFVREDEECGRMDADKLKRLPRLGPVFKPFRGRPSSERTVTAGNASTISDGAAALVVVSLAFARRHGLQPIVALRGWADAAQEPELFTTAPALAIPKALARAGRSIDEVDFFEINEAFSVVALANVKRLGLDRDRVNVCELSAWAAGSSVVGEEKCTSSVAHRQHHPRRRSSVAWTPPRMLRCAHPLYVDICLEARGREARLRRNLQRRRRRFRNGRRDF